MAGLHGSLSYLHLRKLFGEELEGVLAVLLLLPIVLSSSLRDGNGNGNLTPGDTFSRENIQKFKTENMFSFYALSF